MSDDGEEQGRRYRSGGICDMHAALHTAGAQPGCVLPLGTGRVRCDPVCALCKAPLTHLLLL
jgi:hypothetical protein